MQFVSRNIVKSDAAKQNQGLTLITDAGMLEVKNRAQQMTGCVGNLKSGGDGSSRARNH
jgi:hypothetical protein